MRKPLVFLVVAALLVPTAVFAAVRAGEGSFSVQEGRGKVTIVARGAFIGRIDRGSIVVTDMTPEDSFLPYVFGDDNPVRLIGETGMQYSGRNVRFRLGGGYYKLVISGKGIDLAAVGVGTATLVGDGDDSGSYSVDGADCRATSTACKALSDKQKTVKFGSGDRG